MDGCRGDSACGRLRPLRHRHFLAGVEPHPHRRLRIARPAQHLDHQHAVRADRLREPTAAARRAASTRRSHRARRRSACSAPWAEATRARSFAGASFRYSRSRRFQSDTMRESCQSKVSCSAISVAEHHFQMRRAAHEPQHFMHDAHVQRARRRRGDGPTTVSSNLAEPGLDDQQAGTRQSAGPRPRDAAHRSAARPSGVSACADSLRSRESRPSPLRNNAPAASRAPVPKQRSRWGKLSCRFSMRRPAARSIQYHACSSWSSLSRRWSWRSRMRPAASVPISARART